MSLSAEAGRNLAGEIQRGRRSLIRRLALRLGGALLFAWALPLATSGVAVGTPWAFALDAIRGDLGVSDQSGVDVDARVRVFAVGSLALATLAVGTAVVVRWIASRADARPAGRAGVTAVVVLPLIVGSVERWRLPEQPGMQLGDATIDRLVAVGVPALVLGCALAFVSSHREGDGCLATTLRRDAETIIIGVLIVEVAFARPGLGLLLRDAVAHRDDALIRGIVLLIATVVAVCGVIGTEVPTSRRLTRPRALWCAGVTATTIVVGLVVSDVIGLPHPSEVRGVSTTSDRWALFGVDAGGRDNLARVLATARVSLAVAAVATVVLLVTAVAIGFVAGSAGGRFGRRSQAVLALRLPMVLVAGALLAVRERSAPLVAVMLATIVVLPAADVCAIAIDRAWRGREARKLIESVPVVCGVAVSAIGTLFVVEVAFGVLGIVPDGRSTLGREISSQLASVTTTPWPVVTAAGLTALFGWSVTALGYGVAGSEPRSDAIATQSSVDGRPHPDS
jgi:ABC-type dipeptide/oligopeptide/nickel transport system permease subunit